MKVIHLERNEKKIQKITGTRLKQGLMKGSRK